MKNLHTNIKSLSISAAIGAATIPGLISSTANAAPAPFVDDNFYECIKANYAAQFPNDVIATTGLTDEQLAKMTYLSCVTHSSITSPQVLPLNTTINPTGIAKLTNLESLILNDLSISSIDLTANTKLNSLHLVNNDIASIELSHNLALEILNLTDNNQLTTLNVNAGLKELYIKGTGIRRLNISKALYSLKELYADSDASAKNGVILDIDMNCDKANEKIKCDISQLGLLTQRAYIGTLVDPAFFTVDPSSQYTYNGNQIEINIPPVNDGKVYATLATNPNHPRAQLGYAQLAFNIPSESNNNNGGSANTGSNNANSSAKTPDTGANTKKSILTTTAMSYFLPILTGVSTSIFAFLKLRKYSKN